MAKRYEIRDPARVAVSSIRGYWYQLLHTIRAWLLFTDDNHLLVAEGNEDIDRIALENPALAEEEAIKCRSEAITQGDEAITMTVLRYLESFVFHRSAGHEFHGMLRTNAIISAQPETEIGKWILGQRIRPSTLRKELRHLARGARAGFKPFLKQIGSDMETRKFTSSVEWAPHVGDLDAIRSEIDSLVAARAPNIPATIAVQALLVRMLGSMTSQAIEARTVRRIDDDLVLNDTALNILQRSAHAIGKPSRFSLWSTLGPPSVAVAIFTQNADQIVTAVDRARRNDILVGVTRSISEILRDRELVRSLDFLAYASFRERNGPRGERVCIRDVVRQSQHRHMPAEVVLPADALKWIDTWIAKKWPAPHRVDLAAPESLAIELAKLIGGALVQVPRDTELLRTIGTKLRWVHEIDTGQYHTANNPIV